MAHTAPLRWAGAGLLTLIVGWMLLAPLPTVAQDDGMQTHVVRQGETAVGIAARYGVALAQLAATNHLGSLDLAPGTRLLIPAPPGRSGQIHLVRPGETLSLLAARYAVPVADIARANGLDWPAALYVGQRLWIPALAAGPSLPSPLPGAAPGACPAGCAPIELVAPARGSTVTSPVLVRGWGVGHEQPLAIRVLDATGYQIGLGNAQVAGPMGAVGPFSGVVSFTVPANTQPGRIQVYSQSPADGAVEYLTSVMVTLQGSGLDQAVEQVKDGLENKDYGALAASMADPWRMVFVGAESSALSRNQALEQLRTNYLGPGQVFVDLSVDARRLVAEQLSLGADVTHVVFSTGWGATQSDDALLLFSTGDDGRARWSGMVYIFAALRPYPSPGRGVP